MAKKYRYTLERRAIVWESWTVEADSPEEAIELCEQGEADFVPDATQFVDYYDDDYEISDEELLDPFVKMMLEYEPQK